MGHNTKNDRAKDIAQKLLRMAKDGRGNEHEERNAQQLLDQWLVKNDLTLEDIESEDLEKWYYIFDNVEAALFFKQIFHSVVGNDGDEKLSNYTGRRNYLYMKPGEFAVEYTATKADKALMCDRFDFYWMEYNEQKKLFRSAFIQKNELYSNENRTKRTDGDVDFEHLAKLQRLMRGIDKKTMAPKLPEKIFDNHFKN